MLKRSLKLVNVKSERKLQPMGRVGFLGEKDVRVEKAVPVPSK